MEFFFIDMLLMAAVLSIQAVRTEACFRLALKEYNIGLIVHCQCVGLRDLCSGCW